MSDKHTHKYKHNPKEEPIQGRRVTIDLSRNITHTYPRQTFTKEEASWTFIARKWNHYEYNVAKVKWEMANTFVTLEEEKAVSECPCCRKMFKVNMFVTEMLYCCIFCDNVCNPNPFNPDNFVYVKRYLPEKMQRVIFEGMPI